MKNVGPDTPSWNNCWFQHALVEEYLVSESPRGRIVGVKTPSLNNNWFQRAIVEE
ncbi:hypothetical protein N9L68_01945 [bacterium]|nr:hypothetical protein [bacterium]